MRFPHSLHMNNRFFKQEIKEVRFDALLLNNRAAENVIE
jgi:hypothetical protein